MDSKIAGLRGCCVPYIVAVLDLWLSLDVVPVGTASTRPLGHDYGVIIDAGSSGSRARVYSWPPRMDRYIVPEIQEVDRYKKTPGISDFVANLDGLEDYIWELVGEAGNMVPTARHKDTAIYLMATAGMRMLLEDKANDVIDKIDEILSASRNPFQYKSLYTRILSGEEEGVFAWITLNYLRGYFNSKQPDNSEESAGVIEMGGASLQITFMPDGSLLEDKFPVKIAGKTYPLYVHSYLHYGQNLAELWVREDLQRDFPSNATILNPCMLHGDYSLKPEVINGKEITFYGTGEPTSCNEYVHRLVYKVEEHLCHPKPCAIGGVYQPSITTTMPFYALSSFIFTIKTLGALRDNGVFTANETYQAALVYCSKDKATIANETGKSVNNSFLSTECLMGLYIPLMFTNGFGFDSHSQQVMAVDTIDGKPTDWPLGAMIYETERTEWECPDDPQGSTGTASSMTSSLVGILFLIIVGYNIVSVSMYHRILS